MKVTALDFATTIKAVCISVDTRNTSCMFPGLSTFCYAIFKSLTEAPILDPISHSLAVHHLYSLMCPTGTVFSIGRKSMGILIIQIPLLLVSFSSARPGCKLSPAGKSQCGVNARSQCQPSLIYLLPPLNLLPPIDLFQHLQTPAKQNFLLFCIGLFRGYPPNLLLLATSDIPCRHFSYGPQHK